MRRGELYRVHKGSPHDPRSYGVFVVVSRQALLDSRYSTAICAPVYSTFNGLSTQVPLGVDEGLKHESSVHCDELISIPKASLTHFVGALPPAKLQALSRALSIALALDQPAN
ncbi:MAG: type II toxin-antitoxin system PemK/MazF family toxin [Candidatus Latescibacteria bacterium]|jgi:mRNA interferase MazF|nr:type II toxin-antitoxin system PemK/MazF family toxin [Candidatus Latescibacterota bacterium]